MSWRKEDRKALTEKSCKQITGLIYDYLNNRLSRDLKRDFQRHLKICPDCVHFLNTYKKTVAVARTVRVEKIPAKVRESILVFLRKNVRQTGSHS